MPNSTEPSALGKLTVYNPHVNLTSKENEGRTFYVLGERLMASRHKKEGDGAASASSSPKDLRKRKVDVKVDASSGKETEVEASDDPEKMASTRDLTKFQKFSVRARKSVQQEEKMASISVSSTVEDENSEESVTTSSESAKSRFHFKKVIWERAQLSGICRSFAQKDSAFDVYMTKDKALAAAQKSVIYDTQDPKRIHAEAPLFKVLATPFKKKGIEDQSVWDIQELQKVFFLGRSGEVSIEYQEIKKYDKKHTNTDDFIFTSENIQDLISKPVKISQDLKAPIILAVLTFIMQIVQTVISAYIPDADCSSNTGTTTPITIPTSLS